VGELIYIANISLDGYVADRAGSIGFTVPTPEVFSTILAVVRRAGTYLYGRRMYEVMAPWETAHLTPDAPTFVPELGSELEREFANVWRAADKLVFSTTLTTTATQRTRVLSSFEADAIRRLKRDQTLTVGGPQLAAAMMEADLVDELHAFVSPVILGGGNPWLPPDLHRTLSLAGARRLGGVVHLHYAHDADQKFRTRNTSRPPAK
jgi:dihydrofolate reductase